MQISALLEFDLILVEGLWNTGKSTLCIKMKEDHGYVYIQEPDHKTKNITETNQINDFYIEAHLNNLKSAITLIKTGKKVIIERTVLSTIIYNVYINKFSLSSYHNKLDEFNQLISEVNVNKCIIVMKADTRQTTAYVRHHVSSEINNKILTNMNNMLVKIVTSNTKVNKVINFSIWNIS